MTSNQTGSGDEFADVYTESAMRARSPRYRFPVEQQDPREVYQLVHDELLLDGSARMNLATFCTTWVEPEVRLLMDESLDKNIIDKDEYPQTAALETRCVAMLADLFHAPDPEHAVGTSTVGSSEAAMLGGLAAKWRWRTARQRAGLPATAPNVVSGPVQVCWEKFARYFDVELRQAPMPAGHVLTPEQVVERCDENTIAVVVTFGQTFTGRYEDVAAISAALDELQERTGLDVPIHVDAASGAFVGAFCAPDVVWDFRLPRVKSINASGHKTGLAPIGSGWALWREPGDLPRELVFTVDYLGAELDTVTLNFSRPGGQVIASYFTFLRLGSDGYRAVQTATYDVAKHLATEIAGMGPFRLLFDGDPRSGIPAVTWTLAEPAGAYNLYDLAEALRARGWLVPAYPLPADQEAVTVQRIIVRHGFSEDMADLLLGDLRRALARLDARPPVAPAPADGTGFHHDATPAVAVLPALVPTALVPTALVPTAGPDRGAVR